MNALLFNRSALTILAAIHLLASIASADPTTQPKRKKTAAVPTFANVHYGDDARQILDVYQAPALPAAPGPTPAIVIIHGGGWLVGDKQPVGRIDWALKRGITVIAIDYRYAINTGEWPPVAAPMRDAARALQFVRSKAGEWNIDKHRIAATGGSAGGCTALWLAFHPDMADAKSADPVARESTRLCCVAVNAAQTTLDPQLMKQWTPNSEYGGFAFGFTADAAKGLSEFDAFLAGRERVQKWIDEYSPLSLVSADDPPVFMWYGTPPNAGKAEKDPTHTANFGLPLRDKLRQCGVPCELWYPGTTDDSRQSAADYLVEKLTTK